MLEIAQLSQSYGGGRTLWNVDLSIPDGSCVALMGRNGVGKTTLVKCMMGLLALDGGTITFIDEDITRSPPDQRARRGIGYVPQGRMIFPLLSVKENLLVGLTARMDKSQTIPDHIFDLFPILRDMLNRRGGDLSGGQQQQLAIGRALAMDPKFLILDEPTEGIQPNIVHQIGDVILQLNRELGMTVLLVEQKLPFVRRVASEFCLMEKGQIVAAGEMAQLSDELIGKHLAV